MNGFEAARHIRAKSWGSMTLVALSGRGHEDDRQGQWRPALMSTS
jgi:DNA-binding response OmpR family regulator